MGTSAPIIVASRPAKPLLLCLSHLRWDFVWQRPQHLLTRAARSYDVLFFEEPVHEPVAAPALKMRTCQNGVRIITPVLPESASASSQRATLRTLLDALIAQQGRTVSLLWYYTPSALAFSRHIQAEVTVYDNMDELCAFKNPPPGLMELESELLARADIVFTGGYSLFEAKQNRHHNIHPFPSSVDVAHFAQALDDQPDPSDQAHLPKPRLGYFGVIDERMDTQLVGQLADLRPRWSIVMLGPVVKIDAASLPVRPNLHWLGGKDYAALPAYLAHWDAGFMPFALNDATRYISPTKTPEFLAAGVPVVSTAIRDVVRGYGESGLVEIAGDAASMARALDRIIGLPGDLWYERVRRRLKDLSWDRTWLQMLSLIRSAQAAQPSRTATRTTGSYQEAAGV